MAGLPKGHAFWGNSESSVKLLRTLVFVVFAIALGDVYFLKDLLLLDSYLTAARNAPQVFLGIVQPNGFSGFVLAGIAAVRYVMLACLVSILVKRFSRRVLSASLPILVVLYVL
jgi:hypothetical protein